MTTQEKMILKQYESGADAFKGCLFLLFVIGAVLGTIGTIAYLNL